MSLFLYISDSNQFLVMITSVESLKLALHVITDFFFFFFFFESLQSHPTW